MTEKHIFIEVLKTKITLPYTWHRKKLMKELIKLTIGLNKTLQGKVLYEQGIVFRNTRIINYLLILRLPSLQTNGVKGRNHHHFEVYVTPISHIQVSCRDEKTCSTDLEKNWCSVYAFKRNAFLQFKKSSLVLIIHFMVLFYK